MARMGLVTSERAYKVYVFLAQSGPCPIDALQVLFGRRVYKAVRTLVGAGYARRVRVRGVEFAALRAQGISPEHEILGWFSVRLAEVGGFYAYNKRKAHFPSRNILEVSVREGEDIVYVGDLAWDIEGLQKEGIIEAAKKIS